MKWWATEFGVPEIHAVTDAIKDRCISQGKLTRQFEEALGETLGVPYVVCTTSGTTALTMALMASDEGFQREVTVPDRTWIATAHAVLMTGSEIRLVDVREDEPTILDVERKTFTRVLPVNLNGRLAYCGHRDIEDSCQSFPNPPRGLIACYSLSVAKIISTGQGGFCATRDEGLYKELLALRTHDVADAMVPQVLEWKRFGYNFRFTDIQASIGLAQLKKLPARLEAIKEIHAEYKRNGVPVCETPTPLYNELLCKSHVEQETLRSYLQTHGIEARPFYPSLHTAPYLRPPNKTKYHDYEFPNSEKWSHGLILPSGPNQNISDIKRVSEVINGYQGN